MKGWVGLVGWPAADGLPISGHPSAAGRAQDRESSPVRDRRSTTVLRHQPPSGTKQESPRSIWPWLGRSPFTSPAIRRCLIVRAKCEMCSDGVEQHVGYAAWRHHDHVVDRQMPHLQQRRPDVIADVTADDVIQLPGGHVNARLSRQLLD